MFEEKIIKVHSCNDCPYFNSVTDDAMFGTYIECKKGVFGIYEKLRKKEKYNKTKEIINQFRIHPDCILSENEDKNTLKQINKIQRDNELQDKDMAKILHGLTYSSYTNDVQEFVRKYTKIYSVDKMEKLMGRYQKMAKASGYIPQIKTHDDLLEYWKHVYICMGWRTQDIFFNPIYIIYASY